MADRKQLKKPKVNKVRTAKIVRARIIDKKTLSTADKNNQVIAATVGGALLGNLIIPGIGGAIVGGLVGALIGNDSVEKNQK